jgi:hypothetical protein
MAQPVSMYVLDSIYIGQCTFWPPFDGPSGVSGKEERLYVKIIETMPLTF